MPSKESLERVKKLRHKLRLGFQYAKEETAFDEAAADLLDEAIGEEAEQWHNMPSDHDCKQYPENWGCRRLVQLREGKT